MNNLINNPVLEKFLAIIFLLIVLLSGYFLFNNFYLGYLFNIDDDINFKNLKIAKVNSILSIEKELQKKITLQKYKLNKEKIFLTNNKPSTASSELQNVVKRMIVSQSTANILTIKPYPIVKYDNYTETSIEIRMKNVGHTGIQNILYMIENNSTTLLIKELDIKRTQLRYKSLVKAEDSAEKLEVNLVVSAFFREGAG